MIKNIKNDIELSSFYVVFGGSIQNEKPGWYGLSHLMEHIVCKSFEHLQDEFQRYDISWNAYTSNSEVVFHISGLDEHIKKYRKPFLDAILSYEPTDEHLQHEKKIVLEEYKDSFNNQIESHYTNLFRKLYGCYSPIGLRSDIENYTLEDAKAYSYLYLKQPTLIINISKNSPFDEKVEFRVQKNQFEYKEEPRPTFNITTKIEEKEVPDGMVPIEKFNEFKNKESILLFGKPINDQHNKIQFVAKMLGEGLNSPMVQEVREKHGLVYYISTFVNRLNNGTSQIVIATETSPENVESVLEQVKLVLGNKEKYMTQERFDVIKDNLLTKIKTDEILVHNRAKEFIKPINFRISEIINSITLQEVHKILDRHFTIEDFYISVYNEEFKN